MPEPLTIRASSLDGWNACPRRAYAKQFRPELEERGVTLNPYIPNFNTLVGSCVHALAEHPPEEANERVANWFEAELRVMGDDAPVKRTAAVPGWEAAHEQATRILRKMGSLRQVRNLRSSRSDLLVESALSHDFGRVKLTGHVDLYNTAERSLLDVKCSGKGEAPRYDAQIGAYSLLLTYNDMPPKKATVVWMPVVTLDSPQPEPVEDEYPVKVAAKHAATTAGLARRVIEWVREKADKENRQVEGADLPATPGGWPCNAAYCPAHGTDFCPAYPPKED